MDNSSPAPNLLNPRGDETTGPVVSSLQMTVVQADAGAADMLRELSLLGGTADGNGMLNRAPETSSDVPRGDQGLRNIFDRVPATGSMNTYGNLTEMDYGRFFDDQGRS
jgi:hypothetical protein